MNHIIKIKSISEFHRLRNLPEPDHPLISVVNYADLELPGSDSSQPWVYDFYTISIKRNLNGKIIYGQQEYDFDEGMMFFLAPGQVFSIVADPNASPNRSGWLLLVHPDFLWNTTLAKTIRQYDYFDYSVHEALFLSKKEEEIILRMIDNIRDEYHGHIDQFTQNIIVSQIDTLLNYADRFYQRQFITRKMANHQVLERLEELLNNYFQQDELIRKGTPTVNYISEQLHLTPGYLSGLLKSLTGKSTQHHIQDKLIEQAKARLTTSELSISEIAYSLGFEYPQTFSKLFKAKTSQTPLEFRKSFP